MRICTSTARLPGAAPLDSESQGGGPSDEFDDHLQEPRPSSRYATGTRHVRKVDLFFLKKSPLYSSLTVDIRDENLFKSSLYGGLLCI